MNKKARSARLFPPAVGINGLIDDGSIDFSPLELACNAVLLLLQGRAGVACVTAPLLGIINFWGG